VHATHAPRSQPILVPVRPRSSRSALASVVRGSTATRCRSPLTVSSICTAPGPSLLACPAAADASIASPSSAAAPVSTPAPLTKPRLVIFSLSPDIGTSAKEGPHLALDRSARHGHGNGADAGRTGVRGPGGLVPQVAPGRSGLRGERRRPGG